LAFDVLWLDGSWLVDHPHADRRRLLERLHELSDTALSVVSSFAATDVDDLPAGCKDLDLEGVVLKRSASRYRPGRSRDWAEGQDELLARRAPAGPPTDHAACRHPITGAR
jgi:bifunctional non-homologous end joining protein LigD